jgi:quercetin dioxygenase-like cupin family protein
MAKIEFRPAGTVPWTRSTDGGRDDSRGDRIEVDDDGAGARMYHPGAEGELQAFEVRLGPNQSIDAHAHRLDEVIYVVAGSMHFGAQVLEPGSTAYIPANTLYGFRAGPDGLRFVNFRAGSGAGHIPKDEFLTNRAG